MKIILGSILSIGSLTFLVIIIYVSITEGYRNGELSLILVMSGTFIVCLSGVIYPILTNFWAIEDKVPKPNSSIPKYKRKIKLLELQIKEKELQEKLSGKTD